MVYYIFSFTIVLISAFLLIKLDMTSYSNLGLAILVIFLASMLFSIAYTAYVTNVRDWDKKIKEVGWDKLSRQDRIKLTTETLLVVGLLIVTAIYIKERFFEREVGFGNFLSTTFLVISARVYIEYRLILAIRAKIKKPEVV